MIFFAFLGGIVYLGLGTLLLIGLACSGQFNPRDRDCLLITLAALVMVLAGFEIVHITVN